MNAVTSSFHVPTRLVALRVLWRGTFCTNDRIGGYRCSMEAHKVDPRGSAIRPDVEEGSGGRIPCARAIWLSESIAVVMAG